MPSVGAFATAYSGAVSSRKLAARARVRVTPRRMRICHGSEASSQPLHSRHAAPGARAGEKSGRPALFSLCEIITGDTEATVQRKYDDYLEQTNYEGELALMSGWAGIDFGQIDLDHLWSTSRPTPCRA